MIIDSWRKLEEICTEKVLCMKQKLLTDRGEYCKFQCDGFNKNCDYYMSIKNAQIPFKKGIYAYELMRELK